MAVYQLNGMLVHCKARLRKTYVLGSRRYAVASPMTRQQASESTTAAPPSAIKPVTSAKLRGIKRRLIDGIDQARKHMYPAHL